MIESEIKNFFYMNGYTPEFDAGFHSYRGNAYECLTFTDSSKGKVIDCVYLSKNEVLIGKIRDRNAPFTNDIFKKLERMKSSEENFHIFLESTSLNDDANIDTTEIVAEIKARKGQQRYRDKLLTLWNGQCALTGIDIPELLVGSHAKAWQYSNDKERLDEYNGFLFEARIDKLFDKYLISFDDEGKILISSKLSLDQQLKLCLNPNMQLRWISEKHLPYLEFHRKKLCEIEQKEGK